MYIYIQYFYHNILTLYSKKCQSTYTITIYILIIHLHTVTMPLPSPAAGLSGRRSAASCPVGSCGP